MPPFNFDEHVDRAALDALPEDGIPEGLDEREQDETIDDDDAGVVSGSGKERSDDDGSGSHDGRCRLHMFSDEDESDNDEQSGENGPADAPINSHLLGTWLADGSGPLATEAHRHARLADIGLDSALNTLHDTPHTEPRATSITVRKLATRLVAMGCLNGQAAEAYVVIGRAASRTSFERGAARKLFRWEWFGVQPPAHDWTLTSRGICGCIEWDSRRWHPRVTVPNAGSRYDPVDRIQSAWIYDALLPDLVSVRSRALRGRASHV